MTQVSVELREANGTLVTALTNAYEVACSTALDEVGRGSFKLPFDDPAVAQLTVGREVRFMLDTTPSFSVRIEKQPAITLISPEEEAHQFYEVQARGVAQAFDGARVYPQKGVTDPLSPQHRIYSFASNDFPNAGSWVAATQLNLQSFLDPVRHDFIYRYQVETDGTQTLLERVDATAPIGWPVPTAYWIWGQTPTTPLGFNYFRKSISVGSSGMVNFSVSADNYYTLFLDGTPILGDTGEEGDTTWKMQRTLKMYLPAGTYQLAAAVENVDNGLTNPAAFLFAMYTTDDEDAVTGVICVSDSSWSALAYPTNVPGWTPGQVVLDHLAEAQARTALAGWTCDATATVDSHGNAWSVVSGGSGFMPMFSLPIGSSMMDMLNSLVAQGRLDWSVSPTGHVLHLYNPGEVTASAATLAVTLDRLTQNIAGLELAAPQPNVTAFLVKWSGGTFDIEDSTAVALYGRIEGFLSIDAFNKAEAVRMANVALDKSAPATYSHAVVVDPVGADVPLVNFAVGSYVTSPDETLTPVSVRVWSVSITQSPLGRALFTVELNRRVVPPDVENQRLLQTLGRGVTGPTQTFISALSSTKPLNS